MIGPSKHADRDLRRAWVAVALLPVALVLAMVVGEGLISALGYQSGSQEPVPVGPVLLAGVPALLILVAPGVAAVHYGRRAHRAGRREAIVAAWIGGVAAVMVVAQNVLAFLVGR
ncbi:MAG TPA: hypothetical protein VJB61_11260 [Actinomycetota bacterium]